MRCSTARLSLKKRAYRQTALEASADRDAEVAAATQRVDKAAAEAVICIRIAKDQQRAVFDRQVIDVEVDPAIVVPETEPCSD